VKNFNLDSRHKGVFISYSIRKYHIFIANVSSTKILKLFSEKMQKLSHGQHFFFIPKTFLIFLEYILMRIDNTHEKHIICTRG